MPILACLVLVAPQSEVLVASVLAALLAALGIVENAYDETGLIRAVLPHELEAQDKELLALAQSRPRDFTFSSSGNGSPSHLSGELFRTATKIDMQHVPYKGGGPAIADLIGGQVQMMFNSVQTAAPRGSEAPQAAEPSVVVPSVLTPPEPAPVTTAEVAPAPALAPAS